MVGRSRTSDQRGDFVEEIPASTAEGTAERIVAHIAEGISERSADGIAGGIAETGPGAEPESDLGSH